MVDVTDTVRAVIERSDWRQELARDEASTAVRLQQAYQRALPVIRQRQNDLIEAMQAATARGEPVNPVMVRDMQEYSRLLVQVEVEMNDFSRILSGEMSLLSDSAIQSGINAALEMTAGMASAPGAIRAAWMRPNPAAIRSVAQYMENAAMQSNLSRFGQNAARDISDLIITMAAQGKNPRFTAAALADWNNIPYAWADNMARTVQIYSARTASHASYAVNQDILDGWMWVSATDTRTCISCWSRHGRIYGLNQMLNDHHRGRCTPVPVVKGSTWTDQFPTGPAVFDTLDKSQQAEIMGPSLYEAYQSGNANWQDFSRPYQDKVYGEMIRAASVREIVSSSRVAVP